MNKIPFLKSYLIAWLVTVFVGLNVSFSQNSHLKYGPYEKLAKPKDDRIVEASGIAASYQEPSMFWVHNDSGHPAEIFLCNPETGKTIKSGLVKDAKNKDWEDIASFKKDGKSYLIIGSFGDNKRKRDDYDLYLLEEPSKKSKGPFPYLKKITYTYERGKSYNCESLAVDVSTETIYLITKTENPNATKVFSIPLVFNKLRKEKLVAKLVATPKIKSATGMDISPDGLRAVVVTNKNNDCRLYQFSRLPNQTWAQGFLSTPSVFKTPIRPTYEAICFALDGKTLYDKSENGNFGKFPVVKD